MNYPSLDINGEHASLKEGIELTVPVAEEIRTFQGHLSITDISSLPADFLNTLVDGFQGKWLGLSGEGMPQLSPEAAEALGRFQGNLSLNDVEEVSTEVAAHLAKHQGELDLNGLLSITEEAGLQLAKHSQPLLLESLDTDLIPSSVLAAFKEAWPEEWGNV